MSEVKDAETRSCPACGGTGRVGVEEQFTLTTPATDREGEPWGFAEFYAGYPVKRARRDAAQAWRQIHAPDSSILRDRILEDVTWRRRRDPEWLRGTIPYPATYLRGRRWEDEQQPEMPRMNEAVAASLTELARFAARKRRP